MPAIYHCAAVDCLRLDFRFERSSSCKRRFSLVEVRVLRSGICPSTPFDPWRCLPRTCCPHFCVSSKTSACLSICVCFGVWKRAWGHPYIQCPAHRSRFLIMQTSMLAQCWSLQGHSGWYVFPSRRSPKSLVGTPG